MSNPFKSLQLFPNAQGDRLQWALDPVFQDPLPYNFTLQITETPDFSELTYEKSVGDTFYAVDDSGLRKNLGDDWFYRVKLVTGAGTYFTDSLQVNSTENMTQNAYAKAKEITRKEFVRMRYTGQPAWLLKRKNYGVVDATQVDEVSGVAMSDNVGGHGVGIEGGYHEPLKFTLSREQTNRQRVFNEQGLGVQENYEFAFRAVGFPSMENRDIVVLANTDQRFNLANIRTVYMPGTTIPILQILQCKLIAPTDTIYKIAMPTS